MRLPLKDMKPYFRSLRSTERRAGTTGLPSVISCLPVRKLATKTSHVWSASSFRARMYSRIGTGSVVTLCSAFLQPAKNSSTIPTGTSRINVPQGHSGSSGNRPLGSFEINDLAFSMFASTSEGLILTLDVSTNLFDSPTRVVIFLLAPILLRAVTRSDAGWLRTARPNI